MRSPFKFLDAYTVQDRKVFFGRDKEKAELYSLVFKTNLLIVYGLSGTGKTSLIQCGLASMFDGPDWYPMLIRRDEDLNAAVVDSMRAVLGDDTQEGLLENVSFLTRKTLRPVYLIFDQFEELFVLGAPEEQKKFMEELRRLLEAGLNAKVLLVMREEYIGQMYPFEETIPHLFDFRFRVEPMGIVKVKQVIVDSFNEFNIHLEEPREETLQLMVDQITDPKMGISLPYLQVYLDMLYRYVYRRKFGNGASGEELPHLDITVEDVKALGRIDDVLERFLTQQTGELNGALRKEFPAFPQNGIQLLLDPFVTDEGTKRPVHYTRQEDVILLDEHVENALPALPEGSLSRAIDLLDQARILRVREDSIELAHDSLAAIVNKKRSHEQRHLQELRKRVINAFEEHQKTGLFLNAKQLATFDEFLPKLQLGDDILAFITASEENIRKEAEEKQQRAQQEQEAKHHKKLARVRGIMLVLTLAFAGGAVFAAVLAYQRAERIEQWMMDYGDQSERLVDETNRARTGRDSIENILTQIEQQFSHLDSIVNHHNNFRSIYINNPELKLELLKTLITFRSLLANDTLTEQEIEEKFASIVGMSFPDLPLGERQFAVGQKVTVSARVQTKEQQDGTDLLQVKWYGPNQKIIGNTQYIELDYNSDHPERVVSASAQFDTPGPYQVQLFNSAGKMIGSEGFEVVDGQGSGLSFLSETDFRIVSAIIDNQPGEDRKKFKSGSTVYYWGRIKCEVPSAVLVIQVVYPDGDLIEWNRHSIELSEGYRIWSAKGFRATGRYEVRVLDSQNTVLAKREFFVG
jgi:hypothetical protein